jgi:uncharacterized protein (DUF1697 family)
VSDTQTYIALLRGVNVGGNNKISMPELKTALEKVGFADVRTYINSGNVIFSGKKNESEVQSECENLIAVRFGLNIAVAVLTAEELADAIAHAPDWWGLPGTDKHNAIFVIPPMTAKEACAEMGEIKPEYEKVACYGKVIFWTAPLATFSRTRWSKMVANKKVYNAITIRNANTAQKLAQLAEK